jgi:hypothetical protein
MIYRESNLPAEFLKLGCPDEQLGVSLQVSGSGPYQGQPPKVAQPAKGKFKNGLLRTSNARKACIDIWK